MLITENKRWAHQSSLSHMINDGLTNNYLPHVYLLIRTSVVYCCRYFSQQWHNIAAWGHNKLLSLLLLSFCPLVCSNSCLSSGFMLSVHMFMTSVDCCLYWWQLKLTIAIIQAPTFTIGVGDEGDSEPSKINEKIGGNK